MKKHSRLVAVLVAAGAITAGTLVATGAGSATTGSAVKQPSARFLSEAKAALVSYIGHNYQPALHAPAPAGAAQAAGTPSLVGSYNWSGYADSSSTSGAFTKVSGSWTTPSIKCTAEDTITSEWVGIDGWTSTTVEQDGTLDWCFEGVATYYTWYEMYPAGTIEVGATLKPGDHIGASVSRSGTTYTLSVTDSTNTANSFKKTETCAASTCLDTSAEWVAERPAFSIGIAPLAHYSTWSMSKGSETAGGVTGTISSYATSDQISMIDATQSYDLSTASALTSGKSFKTTWANSY